jgi:hypothetical protein
MKRLMADLPASRADEPAGVGEGFRVAPNSNK